MSHRLLAESGLTNKAGPALHADGMHVVGDAILGQEFKAEGKGDVTLALPGAHIGGRLELHTGQVTNTSSARALLDIDGLMYAGIPVTPGDWLGVIKDSTARYASQPYQQLAAAHRAAGHDAQVRRVLIAQRDDQIGRNALTGRRERTWARFTGVMLGYGYRPSRALWCLAVVLMAIVVLTLTLAYRGGLAGIDPDAKTAAPCSTVEQLSVGLDFGLPLVSTGATDRCAPTNTAAGDAVTLIGWGAQLLAWGFATLFVAGFTGAVRKT